MISAPTQNCGSHGIEIPRKFLDELFSSADPTFYQNHKLTPLIYFHARDQGLGGQIQPTTLLTLKKQYYFTAASNLVKLHLAARVFEAFDEANTLVIPLKGIVFLETLYRDPGARPMTDVDLLIHPKTVQKAIGVLEGLGYHCVSSYRGSYNFVNQKNTVLFDVHTEFTRYRQLFNISDEEIYHRLIEITVNNCAKVQSLCQEHQLTHLALHLAPGLYSQPNLINLIDMYHLVNNQDPPIDWGYLVDFAKRSRTAPYIYAPLFLCASLFQANIPHPALEELSESVSRRKTKYIKGYYFDRILNSNAVGTRIFLERLLWAPKTSDKLKLLWASLCSSRQNLANRLRDRITQHRC